ncbi:hypothetical protein K2173_017705 [Erythroxylum novogranatense]|uniref:very-long-chain 3-oxoacyl-CoA synthase n=1 Tax=Erythroxylum novogranatense TaxID=1862640 RepID=A0AAV8SMA4_9ROSI|nr:hypothetical protein K2173_017705 [Erythroxylum novogranatense]
MAREEEVERLSTEIVNKGIMEDGSLRFLVRVRRQLPDFLNSVNLQYVRLGYSYFLSHASYLFLLVTLPVLFLLVAAYCHDMNQPPQQSNTFFSFFFFTPNSQRLSALELDAIFTVGLVGFAIYAFLDHFTPRPTYLLEFACYRPPDHLKISKEEFIKLARESGKFNEAAIEYQQRVLKNSGIGDETYMPREVFRPTDYKITLKDGREEAAIVMFGAVDDLLAATKIRPKDIRILVVNCGALNTTPSLSSMIINHYKMRHDINSFNLGGMGCAAGIIAIDLAKDLLTGYPSSYALVVSTEVVSSAWYSGNETDMLLPNCFFRMGAAAILLSNCRVDRRRSKYELKQLVRTHKGMDSRSFKSIHLKEDAEGKMGLWVSKDVIEVGGRALKANITVLGPLVLPPFKQLHLFANLLFNRKTKPYIPNYKLAFDHVCILATSKMVLDHIQTNLELSEDYMEASRATLNRFGNTSSSSVWYQLAYLEASKRVKKGHRIWQIAFGSGFKCNSIVWKALSTVEKPIRNPWIQDSVL